MPCASARVSTVQGSCDDVTRQRHHHRACRQDDLDIKVCTSGRVGGKVDDHDVGEVEVELEHDKLPDLQPVNWCRTMNSNYIQWVRRSTRPSTSRSCASAWISMAQGGGCCNDITHQQLGPRACRRDELDIKVNEKSGYTYLLIEVVEECARRSRASDLGSAKAIMPVGLQQKRTEISTGSGLTQHSASEFLSRVA